MFLDEKDLTRKKYRSTVGSFIKKEILFSTSYNGN